MYQDIKSLQSSIALLCKERGITINKLASLSGLTQSTIDSIMRGKSKNPKLETLRKIARGFNMEYDDFIAYLRSAEEQLKQPDIKIGKYTCESGLKVAQRLMDLRRERGIALIDIKTATGARINYEERLSQEDFSVLIAIADYFEVSLDYLTGRTDNPQINR